jgi:hypothetical protein
VQFNQQSAALAIALAQGNISDIITISLISQANKLEPKDASMTISTYSPPHCRYSSP